MNTTENISLPLPGRSWRNIRQEVQPVAMSRKGRRRRRLEWAKLGALLIFSATAAWGLFEVVLSWETDRAGLASAVHSAPLREIVLITDGVLTKKWVSGMLAVPESASLMALNLTALRDRLLTNSQVRVAVLTRRFPATLVVTLQERTPVARLQASEGEGQPRKLLVAKDGVVYDGLNYDREMLAGLPWLDGFRLVRAGAGYEPIAGMSDVAALLSTAQLQAAHLYRNWLIVSLARLGESDEIVVKAQDLPEIIFSRRHSFFKQIAQLDYIIDDAARVLPTSPLKSVNLSLEGQVPARFENSPDDLATLPPPNFSIQPIQRKGKRDL